jgi:hypothetical protein
MDKLLARLSQAPALQRILKAAGVDLELLMTLKPRLLAYWQQEAPMLMRMFRCGCSTTDGRQASGTGPRAWALAHALPY